MASKARPAGVAVVTGGAGGMGSATAREFVDAGWNDLLLCDIDAERLEEVAVPLRAAGASVEILCGDVADPAFPEQVLAALGERPVAALVHTAGLSPSMGDAARILAVNLDATVHLVEAVRDRMACGAAAVLFASNSSYFPMTPEAKAAFGQPLPAGGSASLVHLTPTSDVAYPASKWGVRQLVKREAKAFGERGARIVSISPGAIDTRMIQLEAGPSPMIATMTSACAMGRIGRPEELAQVAVFLCSSKASYVTGVDWLVDGGQTIAMGFS